MRTTKEFDAYFLRWLKKEKRTTFLVTLPCCNHSIEMVNEAIRVYWKQSLITIDICHNCNTPVILTSTKENISASLTAPDFSDIAYQDIETNCIESLNYWMQEYENEVRKGCFLHWDKWVSRNLVKVEYKNQKWNKL